MSSESDAFSRSSGVELRLDGSPGGLEAAGAASHALATAAGLPAERATRLRVVVEELVREAQGRECIAGDEALVVRVSTNRGALRAEVKDLRLPVDAGDSANAPSRRLAALGFVDELEIASRGRSGNAAAATVAVGSPDAAVGLESPAAPPDRASDQEADALEVRRMTAADAPSLARCFYRCYGYSYKDPMLYEPREIVRALDDGTLRSVVAVSPSGEVVGHVALYTDSGGERVPEAGKLVVDPRFRGHHLSDRLADARLEVARDAGIDGFWAQAVTNHPRSQAEGIRLGAVEVGLLIGASPAEVTMAGLDNANQGRRTLVALYTPLTRTPATIHLPQRHVALIETLADRLQLERRVDTDLQPGEGLTRVRTRVRPQEGVAHLRVEALGARLAEEVATALDHLDGFDLGSVHLDMPTTCPGAGHAVEAVERLGFCFAAWLPAFDDGADVLRLQRVGDHPVEVEHIACARPEGEQLRDHVLAEWHRVRRGGIAGAR